MASIRVTPIGGEPVELPEDTECVTPRQYAYAFVSIDIGRRVARLFSKSRSRHVVRPIWSLARAADEQRKHAFVHIDEAWPLCQIETWRQRAERLERELEALHEGLKRQPCLATVRFMPDCQCIPCVARRGAEEPEESEDSEAAMGWYCAECKDQPPDGCAACR